MFYKVKHSKGVRMLLWTTTNTLAQKWSELESLRYAILILSLSLWKHGSVARAPAISVVSLAKLGYFKDGNFRRRPLLTSVLTA